MASAEYIEFLQMRPVDRLRMVSFEINQQWARVKDSPYFNGWEANLPYGLNRQIARKRGVMNITIGSWVDPTASQRLSDLLLSQTPGEFFHTIDVALTNRSVPDYELKALQDQVYQAVASLNEDNLQSEYFKLCSLTRDSYIDLRMGYTHSDLRGDFLSKVEPQTVPLLMSLSS